MVLLFTYLTITGCTHVQPWLRGHLAKPEMQGAPLELKSAVDQHVYFSKEGASGGGRAAGGGCGCN